MLPPRRLVGKAKSMIRISLMDSDINEKVLIYLSITHFKLP